MNGEPDEAGLAACRARLILKDVLTLPAGEDAVSQPEWLWPRTPPIRGRAAIPTRCLWMTLVEGGNRQVRRMTAHIGHPTMRLIRYQTEDLCLDGLAP